MFRPVMTPHLALILALAATPALAADTAVGDDVVAAQRAALAAETSGKGYGPPAPRDLEMTEGTNARIFQPAPDFSQMNLCNIHFHEGAEHRGGSFTTYAGNGDGAGHGTGFVYDGDLTEAELAPFDGEIDEGGELVPGDTIEVHSSTPPRRSPPVRPWAPA